MFFDWTPAGVPRRVGVAIGDGRMVQASTTDGRVVTGALRNVAGESVTLGSKARWKAWAEAKAEVTVTIRIATDEHPPDRVDRVVLVGRTVTGSDAIPIDTIELTVWAAVVKTDQGWRIRTLQFCGSTSCSSCVLETIDLDVEVIVDEVADDRRISAIEFQ